MHTFINVEDIGPLEKALAEAMEIKNDRYKYQHLGKNKTQVSASGQEQDAHDDIL